MVSILCCCLISIIVADDAPETTGMTALHQAVLENDLSTARALIKVGTEIHSETEYGITPLHIGCIYGRGEMVELLLDKGVDADSRLPSSETVLMQAARTGSLDVIDALLEHGADPNLSDDRDQTALMWAAAAGHDRAVLRLLEGGAKLDARLDSGFSALDFAAREGHAEVAKVLINAGADVSAIMEPKNTSGRAPRFGMSPLMLAVESGHFELAVTLIELGADPNDQRSGYGPLHAISWVRKPNRGDNVDGDPPPRGSGSMSSLDFVREIIERGADVNLRLNRGSAGKAMLNPKGATPVLLASFTADLPLLDLLVQLGGDVQVTNEDGCGPLQAAAGVGVFVAGEYAGTEEEVLAVVQFLHDRDCDVSLVDANGETAMHGAAYRSFPKVVDLLTSLGANVAVWDRKNKLGSTPLEVAQGKRPGSFKPDPLTIDRIRAAMD